ncbi:ribonuclease E activity regulator RraA [Bacillus sp. 165]|uniref:ribonuclease E activity regulator RraA n=1 Tax=Bacillus sp. 165 TaxID=1529117 RepID=UPI001ADB8A10|nr:ribonuclease E activity regulator RraA [Bacillus sp. 165]MBO9129169.1 ribonuclease E activity regulator RraA [Bacillus sp. 165]
MTVKTTDLCDAYGEYIQVCEPIFRSFGKRASFYGPIATLKVLDDNVLVRNALETLPAGTVLVVDGQASMRCALLGDNLASIAEKRSLAGIIIHGCVRDSAELKKIEIGVCALATVPKKSNKKGLGEENITLQFAGVKWHPNHYVYVDEDGIIVADRLLGESELAVKE